MSAELAPPDRPVSGRVDREGRLVEADPRLADLHAGAGGEADGALAVPQVASLARLAQRLGIVVSRPVIAAEGTHDLDLWVRAEPDAEGVALSITGWVERPARLPAAGPPAERESDFLRAGADWMWETDAALRFSTVSAAAAAAAGVRPGDLVGKGLAELFRLSDDGEEALPILGAIGERRRFDGQIAELRTAPGRYYRLSGVPLIDGAGAFAGFRGSATAVRATSPAAPNDTPVPAPSAFGDRLDGALRVPLNRIIESADTIGAQPDGPLRRDYVVYARDIAAAGRHLLALVDDLVDLQAIERPDFVPEKEEIDLADVARRAAGLLAVRAQAAGVRIDIPSAEDRVLATGAFKRVLQILVNLLSNAVRYSPADGQVWIRTEREDDMALVIVADQGKGIDAADQARIFEKFERVDPTEPGGTGLGLYIARRLARAMGGDLAVDSAPGLGARFTLTLPARG